MNEELSNKIGNMESEIKEIENLYYQDLGKELDYSYPKKDSEENTEERYNILNDVVNELWIRLITDALNLLLNVIQKRKYKSIDFSDDQSRIEKFREDLRLNRKKNLELKNIYYDVVKKDLSLRISRKTDLEHEKQKDKIKWFLLGVAVTIVLGIIIQFLTSTGK